MSFRALPSMVDHGKNKEYLFTPEIRAAIDRQIAKYPPERRQSAVMAALTIVQDNHGGWLTREQMDDIAAYLDMPAISVYEVATFYSLYDLQPVGRHKICVCNSVSCMLSGAEELIAHMRKRYGLAPGGTSADGKFTFKEFECLGACKDAPVVLVDKAYHEGVTIEKLDSLIDRLD